MGFPGGSDGRVHLQCRRPGLDLWVVKIPWRKKWQPIPVFLPGEFHGQRSLAGYIVHGVAKRHDWAANAFTFIGLYGMWTPFKYFPDQTSYYSSLTYHPLDTPAFVSSSKSPRSITGAAPSLHSGLRPITLPQEGAAGHPLQHGPIASHRSDATIPSQFPVALNITLLNYILTKMSHRRFQAQVPRRATWSVGSTE